MWLDRRDESAVVGELDFDGPTPVHDVGCVEGDQDVDVLLTDVEFVMGTEDLQRETGDLASEFHPTMGSSDGVGDGLGMPLAFEGVSLIVGVDS